MSLTYGFYNSVAGDRRYNAEQMSSLFDGIIKDGVFATINDALAVTPSSGMNIVVGAGKAWFKHTWTNNDAPLVLTVDPSEVVLKRIDAVVLEINKNDNTRANSIKIIKGAPSSIPVNPTLVSSELVAQYPLAYISVDAGVTEIISANITNMIGTSSCPFVTGVLETVNIDMLVSKWDGEFNDWFDTIVNILDTNAAANLLNIINTNKTETDTRLDVLDNGVMSNPIVTLGMNSKISYSGESPVIPEIKIEGRSYVNILGKDGNCEDLSKWGTYQCTTTLDTTNKVFGLNGFKGVITGTTGYIATRLKSAVSQLDTTKYYMFSAYVKNGNATNVRLSAEGVSASYQDLITDTTKFTRACIVLTPSQVSAMAGASSFAINVTGASGQYAYVDGIMLNEISASDYNLSEAQLLAKYPYIDSYACTTNPYIQVIHDNLVRNGNGEEGIGWWMPGGSIGITASSNGGFNLAPTALGDKVFQRIKVKPFTDYYCNFNISGSFNIDVCHRKNGLYVQLLNGKIGGTFNSGDCGGEIEIGIYCSGSISGGAFDSIILIEGTTAPAVYKKYADIASDFTGKITGSTTGNPNMFRRTASNLSTSALQTPTTLMSIGDPIQSVYDNIKALDGQYASSPTNVNLQIPQQMIAIDLISLFERKYGPILANTLAEKVAFIKKNISKITFNWHGFGICPSGNKAIVKWWVNDALTWTSTVNSHTNSTVSLIQIILSNGLSSLIDDNGFIYYLAYTDASNGTITSTINTDFVYININFEASYKSFQSERMVIETRLTNDDSIKVDNGNVTGLIKWKHKALFGKDYDWKYYSDKTAWKSFRMTNPNGAIPSSSYGNLDKNCLVKYDGSIPPYTSTDTVSEAFCIYSDGYTYISAKDSDSGWAESINPTDDEVKAFMNGWRAFLFNGTRVGIWTSLADMSLCPANFYTTSNASNAIGQKNLVVVDASRFAVGDAVAYSNGIANTWEFNLIASIAGNTITLVNNMTITCVTGNQIIKSNSGTGNDVLTYCKNNIAPGYQGYQLHYKLVNPEPLTDTTARIEGDIPKFDIGDNYLFLDCGMVLNELATPYLSGDTYWYINDRGDVSQFKYPTENISTIYKNGIPDNLKWNFQINSSWANGAMRLYTTNANCDPNSAYYIDYKILSTMAPSVGVATCSYNQDVLTAISKLTEVVENKQTKDSIFDNIVDLSMYEVGSYPDVIGNYMYPSWAQDSSWLYINLFVPFMALKKTIPSINLANVNILKGQNATISVNITDKCSLYTLMITRQGVTIVYRTNDTATISDIKAYGALVRLKYTADCRGRI